VITASFVPDAAERPRVLLADDHPAMLALTAGVLSGECFVVGSVGDGCELLAETERLHPDVIVRAGCRAKLVFLSVHE
jgi:CheY-like chemotaxis protein